MEFCSACRRFISGFYRVVCIIGEVAQRYPMIFQDGQPGVDGVFGVALRYSDSRCIWPKTGTRYICVVDWSLCILSKLQYVFGWGILLTKWSRLKRLRFHPSYTSNGEQYSKCTSISLTSNSWICQDSAGSMSGPDIYKSTDYSWLMKHKMGRRYGFTLHLSCGSRWSRLVSQTFLSHHVQ